MALVGSSKRPDAEAHELLLRAPIVLFSLHADSAGAVAYHWWSKVYPNLKLCLPSIGKSPGEAYNMGINLRDWVLGVLST